MRPLWKILEQCIDQKKMVRFASFPGGHITLGVYGNKEQTEQYLYESKSGDLKEIEIQVMKDFPHLGTQNISGLKAASPTAPPMPIPPGFPKPPGV